MTMKEQEAAEKMYAGTPPEVALITDAGQGIGQTIALRLANVGAALTGWRRPGGKKCQEKQLNYPT